VNNTEYGNYLDRQDIGREYFDIKVKGEFYAER
jgi:hypothetical protein